ncbi:MAG: hypothetical protein KDI45_02030 [Candidatus Accumulibacter sp.]|nr:hypothetical protein [Accumulibacter sp.]MCB1965294.1 hypothetical protein [Accumulibacter sp.]
MFQVQDERIQPAQSERKEKAKHDQENYRQQATDHCVVAERPSGPTGQTEIICKGNLVRSAGLIGLLALGGES